jgi:hypothetical protein
VRFSLGGTDYEIDLSKRNAAAFRRQLAPFVEAARRAGPRRRPVRSAVSRERSADIRAWAKQQGIAVSPRGRIPASVVEQYEAAVRSPGPASTPRRPPKLVPVQAPAERQTPK